MTSQVWVRIQLDEFHYGVWTRRTPVFSYWGEEYYVAYSSGRVRCNNNHVMERVTILSHWTDQMTKYTSLTVDLTFSLDNSSRLSKFIRLTWTFFINSSIDSRQKFWPLICCEILQIAGPLGKNTYFSSFWNLTTAKNCWNISTYLCKRHKFLRKRDYSLNVFLSQLVLLLTHFAAELQHNSTTKKLIW